METATELYYTGSAKARHEWVIMFLKKTLNPWDVPLCNHVKLGDARMGEEITEMLQDRHLVQKVITCYHCSASISIRGNRDPGSWSLTVVVKRDLGFCRTPHDHHWCNQLCHLAPAFGNSWERSYPTVAPTTTNAITDDGGRHLHAHMPLSLDAQKSLDALDVVGG